MLLIELLGLAGAGLLAWFGGHAAIEGVLVKAQIYGGEEIRTVSEVHAAALQATLKFLGGIAALAVGRFVSLRRGHSNVDAPLLLPAAAAAAALGFGLQLGYGDPIHRSFWPGPDFAQGFLIASMLGALILVLPRDPSEVFGVLQPLLPPLMAATFVALSIWGEGTEFAPDTKINLFGIQPVELVKLIFVIFLAQYFGRRAAKLRHQRDRLFGMEFPRYRLLVPALLIFVLLFTAFILVKDLGPTLILSIVFLTLFYIATRAGGWVIAALLMVAGLVTLAARVPAIARSPKVVLRMQMWLDPWYNGLPFGDQGAYGRWAIAAGHLTGQGFGFAPPAALPAGHTDLAIAHLAEELGFVGHLLYILLLAAIAGQGLWVAAWNRTAERVFLAAGLAILLMSQWAVIFSGTTGVLPLTGVISPYIAYGKTSMIVFILLAAMLARLAESGRAREQTTELAEVRYGVMGAMAASFILLAGGIVVALLEGVVFSSDISTRGVVTLLEKKPGETSDHVAHNHDPRLESIARRIGRGDILDRNGVKIAGTSPDNRREYPLRDAIGTLLGPPEAVILRPAWNLERQLDPRLRGYPEYEDGPAVWMAGPENGTSERMLFVVTSQQEKREDRDRAESMKQPGEDVRLLALPSPDFHPLLPILRMGGPAREKAIEKLVADRTNRTAYVSLDARLQTAVSGVLKSWAKKGKAAAAVIMEVDTGKILARVQWPDFDPGSPAFQSRLHDPAFFADKKWIGAYGPWPDKTGLFGIYQGGSAAKLYTSLVAAREGVLTTGPGCLVTDGPHFACVSRDAQGPFFIKPGWYKAIHDFPEDSPHGHPDFIRGLAVSCNVYFGQLGLQLGPDAYKRLLADGVEIGWGSYEPGKAGSRELAETAFGQNAALMNVSQSARMVGTIASGGIYRKCPASLERDAPCEQKQILKDPSLAAPILSGMAQVMVAGTGIGLKPPPGVRVYGKTGTADAFGTKEEQPFGVVVGEWGTPHSWFESISEPDSLPSCNPTNPGRIAMAVVIPRSGQGARFAGPASMEILAAMTQLGYFRQPQPGAGQTAPGAAAPPSGASPPAGASPAPAASPRAGGFVPAPASASPASPTPAATPSAASYGPQRVRSPRPTASPQPTASASPAAESPAPAAATTPTPRPATPTPRPASASPEATPTPTPQPTPSPTG
ncbi:MAG TPA: FtsW/RodA/SpoVE family cell cycle protein [Vicinamibacteria bacterium]|nr:FtsW/RodA/SpoVE family cell cycle protein [Vicinamibacteria bacterium]